MEITPALPGRGEAGWMMELLSLRCCWIKRLLRRLRWLLIYNWRSLRWPYESCWMCGKAFRVMWSVEDKYWRDVVGVPDDGGGSLCVDCFLEYADYLGIKVPDEAFNIKVFQPE